MKKAILAISALVLFAVPSFGQSSHALVSVASVAASPVTHPKRTFKQIVGSVLFAGENVVDVVHAGLFELDKSTATELKALNYIIHPAEVVSAKADSDLEKAEQYFFGSSN